jgi:hypothetical protein
LVAKLPYLYFDAASFIPNMGGVSGGPVDGVTIEDLNDDDLLDYEWMENEPAERGQISDKTVPVQVTQELAIGGSVMPSSNAMTAAMQPMAEGTVALSPNQPLPKTKKAELQSSAKGEKATPKRSRRRQTQLMKTR